MYGCGSQRRTGEDRSPPVPHIVLWNGDGRHHLLLVMGEVGAVVVRAHRGREVELAARDVAIVSPMKPLTPLIPSVFSEFSCGSQVCKLIRMLCPIGRSLGLYSCRLELMQ